MIPDEEVVAFDENNDKEDVNSDNDFDKMDGIEESSFVNNDKNQEEQNKKSDNNAREGEFFVIQKGTCQCNQGFKFPKLKVTSHQKHYWNDVNEQADYLAVTEDDLTFDPPAMPFGNCKLRPTSGGYLPCVYAPAGKWQKTYEKVKVLDKSCVTDTSELMCATGGKITVLKHGQQSEVGKKNVEQADSFVEQRINPVVDFEEYKDEVAGNHHFYI